MAEGGFYYRNPPKSTWETSYRDSRPANAIIGAKGLVPILKVRSSEKPNILRARNCPVEAHMDGNLNHKPTPLGAGN